MVKLKFNCIILVAFFGTAASAYDCKAHPLYCQIKTNKPSIKDSFAFELSNIIYSITKKYNIPSNIYTAILMQESGYSLAAKNCTKGYRWKSSTEVEADLEECRGKDNRVF